ncbi:MAG: PEP-CTERM system TPR-repeat protein PrsT [Zoogloea sp.]|nr:XrtA/PEP-CTERM system TPR-repeat protein PrsT [Zoogloea sp.]MDD3328085.1 PEP-CTERM system TPR-repeat protein PrsT [Zoogloea sp.]
MRAQSKRSHVRNVAISALCALLLTACGEKPESMIASAKDYIAKNDRPAATIQLKNALQKDAGLGEARYLLGKIYLEQGDYPGAEKELSRAFEAGYAPDQVVPLLAQTLVQSGQGDKLATQFASTNLTQPEARAAFKTYEGLAALSKGKRDEAVAAFAEALKESPGFPLARTAQVRLQAMGGDLKAALDEVDAVLKDAPKLPEANLLRGDLLVALNRNDEAVAAYEAVVAERPSDILAHQNMVSVLLRDNKVDVAQGKVAAMRKALNNHPLSVYLQAYINVRNNKVDEAYEGVQQVLRAAPEYMPALLLAATLQLQRQDFVQAQENLKKVLEKAPNMRLARRLLVSVHVGQREPARALEALQPLLKERTDDVTLLNLAGQVYAMNGDFARSEEYFGRASAADPKNAQFRTRLGVSRLAGGEVDQAFQDLEAASALDATNIQADITLIMAHLRRNEVAKAMAAVQTLEKKRPNDPVTFNMKGGVLIASKDPAGARKAFEKALELKPDFLPALSNLARLDIGDKQIDVARKRYDDFLVKNPKNSQAYLQYAELLAMTGTPVKDVQAVLDRGLAATPTAVPIRVALVRLLAQSGDTKRALLLAQEAAVAAPDDPTILDLLGRAQVAAGEMQQALSTYEKLTSRLPNSPLPLIAQADLQVAAKDLNAAENSLRKALTIKPDAVEAQQRLVALLLNNKRGDAAVGVARDIQKQRKDAAIGYILEGEALIAQGKKAEAVPLFEEAYKRDKSAQSVVRLYAVRVGAGQAQEAAKGVAEWVKANPKDLVVRTYLAERSLAEQKYDQAVQQYRQMLELAPKNPMLLNNLAWALGKLNDKSALEVAQQALALAPNSPVVLDTYGGLLLDNGDGAKGVETLRKAVSLGPKLPQLRVNLARGLAKTGDKDGARKELDEAQKLAPEKSPLRAEIDKVRASL